jgi:iron complex outermembrane receptor protein
MAAFAIHSPLLLANNAYNDNSTQIDNDEFADDFDDSLEDFYGDEEFVSIATGTKKSIHLAPSVATVITAQDIKNMGANTIYDALESITGIHMYPSNLDRMKPNFSIRGIHTSENPQTLVLINGKRANYEYTGSRWEQFNIGINLVEKIEVIRGPGSAIYGADAYSGVINIITKGVDSISGTDFGIKYGSFNTKSTWLNFVKSDDELKYSFNAQWHDYKGDSSRIVEADAMHGFGLGALSIAPSSLDTELETIDIHAELAYKGFYAKAWYLTNDGGTGAGAAQALSNRDYEKTRGVTLSSGYQWQHTDALHFDFSAYYQSYDDDTYFMIFPPGMALPRAFNSQGVPTAFTVFTEGLIGQPIAHEKYRGLNLVSNYTGFEQHRLRFEIGYRTINAELEEYKNFGPGVLDGSEEFQDSTLTNVTGTPFIYMFNQERNLKFLSLQDEWKIAPDWEFTAGARYDHYSDFGSTFNPRLALVWQTKHNLTTKFLYGSAFRAPSFQELYAVNNPVVLGNDNLSPERIKTYEISFDYRPTFDWKLQLNVFSYRSEKMISWLSNGDGTNTAQNATSQSGQGFEVESEWRISDAVDFKVGYAWQKSKDVESDDVVADAPAKMLDMRLQWQVSEDTNLHLDSRWILDRSRLAIDTRDGIKNYSSTNLTASYRISHNMTIDLSVKNLFDKAYFEPSDGQIVGDYPMEKRAAWVSLNYTM